MISCESDAHEFDVKADNSSPPPFIMEYNHFLKKVRNIDTPLICIHIYIYALINILISILT